MSELFDYCFETETLRFKYSKGKPAVTGREFHNFNEFLLFLGGNSQLISENIQQKLVPSTLVIIPKETFHQFCVTEPDTYLRCCIGFRDIPEFKDLISDVMTEVKLNENVSDNMLCVFENIIDAMKGDLTDKEKELIIRATIVQLLIMQKQGTQEVISENINISSEVREALKFIDSHIDKNITVQRIAKYLNISVSSLAHKFRSELNISVYRYICEKRISAIRKYVENGDNITTAALKCGFNDYASFYRMYKKYYGQNPTESIKSKQRFFALNT